MKYKLLIIGLVWFIISAFLLSGPNDIQKLNKNTYINPDPKPFLIGSVANGSYNDYSAYSKANMNLWHIYTGYTGGGTPGVPRYPLGWNNLLNINTDLLQNDVWQYSGAVTQKLIENANHGMYSYMMRPKIEYACYGQRSDYQCESIPRPSNPENDITDWFYSYDSNKTGSNIDDGQQTLVRFCEMNDSKSSAGYVVKNLRTNREQCNTFVTNMTQDAIFDWYIMPKIRIPQGISNNTRVCRIDIIGWENNPVISFELTGFSFQDSNYQYNGEYIDKFKQTPDGNREPLIIPVGETIHFNPLNKNWTATGNDDCHFDIRVYWYKECNMWIDYVRVENDIAYNLFNGNLDPWITQETRAICGAAGNPYKFYIEEVEYNTLSCIRYVNELIQATNPKMSVICVPYLCVPAMNSGWINFCKEKSKMVYEYARLKEYYYSAYPLHGDRFSVNGYGVHSYIPNTFPNCEYNMAAGKLGESAPVPVYEDNLQDLLDHHGLFIDNGLATANYISKELKIPFIFLEQAHLWLNESTLDTENYSQREPTNEELEVMGCIGISYGAKGLSYFSYDSWGSFEPNTSQKYQYGRGLMENPAVDTAKRYCNVYGQNKWNKVVELNSKYKKWGEYIMGFDIDSSKSYIYHSQTDRAQLVSETYVNEINTSIANPVSQCAETISNTSMEPQNKTYLQVATFRNPSQQFNNYFMIVNRRCSPGDDDCSGRRFLTISFKANSNQFAGFNNWKIIDLLNDSLIYTFDKRISNSISLGKYKPGEGKLYKIIPVMIDGGTFVCDENVTATTFNCNGIVNTGGYKLNIPATNGLTTISFAQNATIQGYNGTDFNIGGNNQVVLQGQNGNKWRGLSINNYQNVNIYNTKFQNIGDVVPSSYWALSMYNCQNPEISFCDFILPPQAKGININNFGVSDFSNVVIMNNNISTDNSTAAVFVGASALGFCNLFLMDNIITNGAVQSTFGVLLSNVYSSYADRNTITGFKFGLELMTSTLELSDNTISSIGDNNTGILATSSSTINMGLIGNDYIGGNNTFSNSGVNSNNISLSNSIFEMNYGNNNLFVPGNTGNFNLVGNGNFIYTDDGPLPFVYAIGNCFNGEGGFARDSITELNGLRDTLVEIPHNCNLQQDKIADFTAPVINDIVDTVYKSTLPQLQNNSSSVTLYKNFYKSILKRNYDSTKILGTQILTNYSDSIPTSDVISLLYFANTKLANISTNMLTLKTFLEQLIINHPQNLALVRTANYFVQKCKVHLQQYTSALDGYQDIIVQNPYSYEGLVASWDYASTLLLANSGGAYSNNEEESLNSLVFESQFLVDSLRMKRLMNTDKYDKKVFTHDDRKVLIKSVGDVLKDDRQKQIEKVKTLEDDLKKSKGDNTEKVKQKLEEVKNLNSLIKTKKPKDAEEYKVIINNDIEKMYPKKSGGYSNPQNILPTTYALYQNYPNPFNPTTKIAYDIPRDAKVKLVIYDILGREMKTLVNNEFRSAGKYITEFNGSNLASGIYFARILVNEGKDFIAVKKMVLVK